MTDQNMLSEMKLFAESFAENVIGDNDGELYKILDGIHDLFTIAEGEDLVSLAWEDGLDTCFYYVECGNCNEWLSKENFLDIELIGMITSHLFTLGQGGGRRAFDLSDLKKAFGGNIPKWLNDHFGAIDLNTTDIVEIEL